MIARSPGRTLQMLCIACLLLPGMPMTARAFDEEEARAIVGNTRAVEANPGARGLWMARQRVVEIDGIGNAVVTEHVFARVIDPAWGRELFSPFRRIFWGEFTKVEVRARTWRSRVEFADLPPDSVRVGTAPEGDAVGSYGNLRECRVSVPPPSSGEVVELRLKWTCRIPPYDRNVRWLEETFGAEDPVIEQQLVLVTAGAATVDTATVGPRLTTYTTWTEGMRRLTWITGNLRPVPARFVETPWSRVPVPDDTVGTGVSRVVFSTFANWNAAGSYFGAQWEDSWDRRSERIDRFVREAVRKEKDPRARARAIEMATRREYRTLPVPDIAMGMWPLAASLVALERAGGARDKSLLLVAALRGAGIEASPVLVRERRDRWVERVPSLAQFDRWVVRARPSGSEILWLDPVGSPRPIPPGRGLLLTGSRDRFELQKEAGLVDFPGLPATDR